MIEILCRHNSKEMAEAINGLIGNGYKRAGELVVSLSGNYRDSSKLMYQVMELDENKPAIEDLLDQISNLDRELKTINDNYNTLVSNHEHEVKKLKKEINYITDDVVQRGEALNTAKDILKKNLKYFGDTTGKETAVLYSETGASLEAVNDSLNWKGK